jgi:hypothetical protein
MHIRDTGVRSTVITREMKPTSISSVPPQLHPHHHDHKEHEVQLKSLIPRTIQLDENFFLHVNLHVEEGEEKE